MKNIIATPSSQVDSTLPSYIYQNYSNFVTFMTKSAESEERIGFAQDLLQNLQKYRNFDTYKKGIIQYGTLKFGISATEEDELTLEDGFGFPDNNGVILIDDEIILYQSKSGNVFSELQRGASGTTVLPTFRTTGEYANTTPSSHTVGSSVKNISVLFLVAMLEKIHESFTPNISSSRIDPEINRSNLLQNIKDFFASKGSKLGIQALFRMLFGDNDVDVVYPGDRMIVPSKSTWSESLLLRSVPVPEVLCDPSQNYTTPEKVIGSPILYKSYTDSKLYAKSVCDYVSTYPYEDEVQYELHMDEVNTVGSFFANPNTKLKRLLKVSGSANDNQDVTTVTVETTNGFPTSGVIFIESECIRYESKSINQFLGCTRGYIGVEVQHSSGTDVYGPYYIETSHTDEDGVDYYSRSFPLGLVEDVIIKDPGILHSITDEVHINGPARNDPRELAMTSFQENTNYALAGQANVSIGYIGNFTAGVGSVMFDDDYIYVASTELPYYEVGPFSVDNSVGSELTGHNVVYTIPRAYTRTENDYKFKGSGIIGVMADGVPAYSNESNNRLYHGGVTKFNILNSGSNYVNPTVIVGTNTSYLASVTNGRITSISGGSGFFTSIPQVKISTGEGSSFSLTFDKFGRVTGASIIDGGKYYRDTPTIDVVDPTGKGKGALLTCTVSGGKISTVTVVASGLDYTASATQAVAVPIGSGASITAEVEYYTYDRVQEIENNDNTMLDSGNGYVVGGDRFGYLGDPVQLRARMGDNVETTDHPTHSPIIGWAFDGNPIYGPFVYENGVDGNVIRAYSGWQTRGDRTLIKSSNNQYEASAPPSTTTYPIGTFVEDYYYDAEAASFSLGYLNTENELRTLAEDGDAILTQFQPGIILDANNGRVCNTPDYPAELYPDGVYCYFVTSIGETPYFPYIIGQEFENQPVSQNLQLLNGNLDVDNNITGTLDNTLHQVEYDTLQRHRNSGLTSTNDDVDLRIADISSGSVSSVYIESGLPNTTVVDDLLMFDNNQTKGNGAEGIVTFIDGVGIDKSFGQEIQTKLLSHRQRINLKNESSSFTFNIGSTIRTSSGAEMVVVNYDSANKFLDVKTITENLVKFGDIFTDNKGRIITIPSSIDGNDAVMFDTIAGGSNTFISYAQPENDRAVSGDLWWSSETGSLYIYYNDTNNSQWVSTQPYGMRPLAGASGESVGQDGTYTQSYSVPQTENKVTISTMSPSQRTDGSSNQAGDLWWSTESGILYIWNVDKPSDYEVDPNEWSAEWVSTHPFGTLSDDDGRGYSDWGIVTPPTTVFETTVTVIVSEGSPIALPNGDSITPGVLWWSPLNGRMYIYYQDADSSQWVVTNPYGSISSKYGGNNIIVGDGGSFPDYVTFLPEPEDSNQLWVETLKYFDVGDSIEFRLGAPGIDELVETATISKKLNSNQIELIRGQNGNHLDLPHGTPIFNTTKYLYTVDTDEPHKLRNGDKVTIENSTYPDLNKEFTIENAGVVVPASGTCTIINGEITGVTITNPGKFYTKNFYISFVGGGGVGASAFATVAELVDGGGVTAVAMEEGGHNYTSQPTIVFGEETPNTRFTFFTEKDYGEDTTATYITDTQNIRSTAARISVASPGIGYESMPSAIGLYKKQSDRAVTKITLNGTTIGSVEVLNGGIRYVNPLAVFSDLTGSGSGAAATVNLLDGIVQSINVTRSGSGYVEPVLELVEQDGKFIGQTKNIGQIKSVKVVNPGRNISPDVSLQPEIQVESRFIISPITQGTTNWRAGQLVYQGTQNTQLASGTVTNWDSVRQILTIKEIDGFIKENEIIYNVFGTSANVLNEGQADVVVDVNGSSKPEGKFIDDTSEVSASWAVIQDSEYYQYFSYSISSSIQQNRYKQFVNNITHPSGFALFSEFKFTEAVNTVCIPSNVEFGLVQDLSAYDLLLQENNNYLWTEGDSYLQIDEYEVFVTPNGTIVTTQSGDEIDFVVGEPQAIEIGDLITQGDNDIVTTEDDEDIELWNPQ